MKLKLSVKRGLVIFVTIHLCFCLMPAKIGAEPGPEKMIQIEAEVVEVNLTKCLELGIDWPEIISGYETTPTVGTKLDTGVIVPPLRDKDGVVIDPTGIYSWHDHGKIRRLDALKASFKMLDMKGVARPLAKPKLITRSGSTATFHAGGEFPVPVAQEKGAYTMDWKKYGVKLEIKPTVTKEGYIDTEVKAEVSAIDYTIALSKEFGSVPGVTTRSAEARVEVEDGDTIVIAGLKQTRKEKTYRGIPGLCRIPGLGLLFGRQKWINNETDIFIFVSPSIVKKPGVVERP